MYTYVCTHVCINSHINVFVGTYRVFTAQHKGLSYLKAIE